MPSEKGKIVRATQKTAWVKVDRTGSCGGCSEKDICGIKGGAESMEAEAVNEAGAKAGDRVLIDVKSSSVLKAAFLLYVFPILAMIAGAVVGHNAPSFFGMGASAMSAVFGFLFFGIAVLFIRFRGNRLAAKDDYRLRIVKIIRDK